MKDFLFPLKVDGFALLHLYCKYILVEVLDDFKYNKLPLVSLEVRPEVSVTPTFQGVLLKILK